MSNKAIQKQDSKPRRLQPKEARFLKHYLDFNSDTFGNAYQSALQAGYTHETALVITRQKAGLISEYVKNSQLQADDLLLELARIVKGNSSDTDKIKAIQLLMKHKGMLVDRTEVEQRTFNINLNYANRGNEQ